jgi:uncharacterized protein
LIVFKNQVFIYKDFLTTQNTVLFKICSISRQILESHTKLTWDENKRQSNLQKHSLDFANAESVLNSRYRLDVRVTRGAEERIQSFSYVMNRLAVLSLVHLERESQTRIISFRPASKTESEVYYEWLANQSN